MSKTLFRFLLSDIVLILLSNSLSAQVKEDKWANDLIANIHANEALYSSIEAVEEREYNIENKGPDTMAKALKSVKTNLRTVRQGGLFYYKMGQGGITVQERDWSNSVVTGYDGENTRRITDNKVAHIYHKKTPFPCTGFSPHQWLLHTPHPLSRWLKGGNEILARMRSSSSSHGRAQFRNEGREFVEGLDCIKILHEYWETGQNKTERLKQIRMIWLAPDRNFLPIKIQSYSTSASTTIPLATVTAGNFREIAPGIWLPFRRELVVNDDREAKEGNRAVVSNREITTITMAKLDPNYDMSLFRDIPIPDGARVYEVENGKIISSYNNGEHITHSVPTPWWKGWLLPLLGVTLCGISAIAYRLLRRRRMRAARQAL